MTERPTCETCPYAFRQTTRWSETVTATSQQCRRNSPTPSWPSTRLHDYCGEHPDFPAYIEATSKPAAPPAAGVGEEQA